MGALCGNKKERNREREGEGERKEGKAKKRDRYAYIEQSIDCTAAIAVELFCSQSKENVSVVFFRFSMCCMAEKKQLNERQRLTAKITVKIYSNALKSRQKKNSRAY